VEMLAAVVHWDRTGLLPLGPALHGLTEAMATALEDVCQLIGSSGVGS
jgi:hypothetical protein